MNFIYSGIYDTTTFDHNMESVSNLHFIVISATGIAFNVSTFCYILKNFDITVHVYSLLFIDSLISTFSSFASFSLEVLIGNGLLSRSYNYCTLSFLSLFLPTYYGGVLTFLVACIRYTLAKKSAKNIQVSMSQSTFIGNCSIKLDHFSTENNLENARAFWYGRHKMG